MRQLIVVILTLVLLAACQENSSIVNPSSDFDQVTLDKKKKNDSNDDNLVIRQTKEMQVNYSDFLDELLDEKGDPVYDKKGNPVMIYDPDKKVKLSTTYAWKGGVSDGLKYEAVISIYGRCIDWDSGASQIKGKKDDRFLEFDITFSSEHLSADFAPSPFSFVCPVIIDLRWKGLSAEEVREYRKNSNFGYIIGNEFEEPVQFKEIEFDTSEGEIKVKDAEIPHFSRYGFLR